MGDKVQSIEKFRTLKALGIIEPEIADAICGLEEEMLRLTEENSESERLRAAFKPVLHWYDGDGEGPDRTLAEMLDDAVTDLQQDRSDCIRLRARISDASDHLAGVTGLTPGDCLMLEDARKVLDAKRRGEG